MIRGHSIECRINAENPRQGFRPSPGDVKEFFLSGGPGVRIDSHILPGAVISPHYDSMVAKLIVHGSDRAEALARMERALYECRVDGVETTIPFHREVLATPRLPRGSLRHRLPGALSRREGEGGGRRQGDRLARTSHPPFTTATPEDRIGFVALAPPPRRTARGIPRSTHGDFNGGTPGCAR